MISMHAQLVDPRHMLTIPVPRYSDGSVGLQIELCAGHLTVSAARPFEGPFMCGVRAGDILTSIEGRPFGTAEELAEALKSLGSARTVAQLGITRDPGHVSRHRRMVLREGWLEYCTGVDENNRRRTWARGFFILTLAGGLMCLAEEPGWGLVAVKGLIFDTLPFHAINGAEPSGDGEWCLDILTHTDFVRLRAADEMSQRDWVDTINLYSRPSSSVPKSKAVQASLEVLDKVVNTPIPPELPEKALSAPSSPTSVMTSLLLAAYVPTTTSRSASDSQVVSRAAREVKLISTTLVEARMRVARGLKRAARWRRSPLAIESLYQGLLASTSDSAQAVDGCARDEPTTVCDLV